MTMTVDKNSVGIQRGDSLYVIQSGAKILDRINKGEEVSDTQVRFSAYLVVNMITGKIEKIPGIPAVPELDLTERLLLQAATRFAFRGEEPLLGLGFAVSADWDSPYAEFWAILMTNGDDGDPGYVLCHEGNTSQFVWVCELEYGQHSANFGAVSIEEQAEAVKLALSIAQNAVRPHMREEN